MVSHYLTSYAAFFLIWRNLKGACGLEAELEPVGH
jgi:hypothetical protein